MRGEVLRRPWICLFSSSALVALAAGALAEEIAPRPVMIHPLMVDGKPIESGGTYGSVQGLRKGGDGFVSVRAAPSIKANELDRLENGRAVLIFSGDAQAEKNGFVGVVYPAGEGSKGAFGPICQIPEDFYEGPYDGPCKSGWVSRGYVGADAG